MPTIPFKLTIFLIGSILFLICLIFGIEYIIHVKRRKRVSTTKNVKWDSPAKPTVRESPVKLTIRENPAKPTEQDTPVNSPEQEPSEQEPFIPISPINCGEWAERQVVQDLLNEGINPKAIFHNLYIQKRSGEYTQVDVVVATRAGLIVFEVKDYKGWIFGNEHQKYWTQLLAYGTKKYRFYNPVMQNAAHIQAIRQNLPQNPGIPIYSVIVFFGNCEFRNITCNADNTFIIYHNSISQIVSEILRRPNVNFGNKYEIMDLFTKAVQNGNDPMIVTSHTNSASYYDRNRPDPQYTGIHRYYFSPLRKTSRRGIFRLRIFR